MSEYTKIRDFNPTGSITTRRACELYDEYFNLLLNNISITHKDGNAYNPRIEKFIKVHLIECGRVGFDKLLNVWGECWETGKRTEYGDYDHINIRLQNGKTFTRIQRFENTELGAYTIHATPYPFTISTILLNAVNFVANCENAINQNINAVKTPFIISVKDKELKLSIERMLDKKEKGESCVVVDEILGDNIKVLKTDVTYIADKLDELRNKKIDELINKLGIMSANINKKERVQVGEVNATLGQCLDYIYLMIDTFNKQCEYYGIDAKMNDNTSLEEYQREKGGQDNEYLQQE